MASDPLSPEQADQLHARWLADLEELAHLVRQLFLRRQVFEALDDELVRRAQANPGTSIEQSGAFLSADFLRPLYAEAQASTVRRLVDKTKGTKSFVRLLNEMMRNPEVLSRERYVAYYFEPGSPRNDDPTPWLKLANADFDALAGKGAPHVPLALLAEHQAKIVADLDDVKRYVDARIAHHGVNPPDQLTWGQLSDAFDRTADHLRQFSWVVAGATWMASPTMQFDWKAALRPALFSRRLDDFTDFERRVSRSLS